MCKQDESVGQFCFAAKSVFGGIHRDHSVFRAQGSRKGFQEIEMFTGSNTLKWEKVMNKLKGAVFFIAILMFSTVHAVEKTVVLQNGEFYKGARDLYIAHQAFDGLEPDDQALNHYGEKEIYLQNCLE